MSIEVKVPQLPESVADATLVAWHKSPGDKVSRDENLADLETDKVVLEVPAPADGVLKEIRISDGTTVTAGDILAILEEGEASGDAAPAAEASGRGGGRAGAEQARRTTEETR
jgi:2-oxoglutarate dehydrogenase E2 component (dihydrolipoamide succinyltransferase)